jgi:large subunit ribosomal protein L9
MATHIQVVLRESVSKLGKAGELVKVRPGFARNFLVPRGLAVVATEGSVRQIEHERTAALVRAAKLRKESEAIATQLAAVTIHIAKPVGEGEKLYGSVTSKDIAEALEAKGFSIEKKLIQLDDSIRQLGTYDVAIKLAHDVTATVKVEVKSKA